MVKLVMSIGQNCLEESLAEFLASVFQSTDIVCCKSVHIRYSRRDNRQRSFLNSLKIVG